MKVGTSPIYFLPGQESGIEKFSEYIKGKEHEALSLLKKNEFLEDSKQEPAIKVALRAIKDFAKPFEKKDRLIWRYFTVKEEKFEKSEENKKEEIEKERTIEKKDSFEKPEENKEEEIEEKENKKEEKKKRPKEKKPKAKLKKTSKENDEKFFDKVKEYLVKKEIEIEDIVNFNKKDLVLKISENGKEKLLFAYNKKRITEKDILTAYKKSGENEMKYMVLSLGEAPKKTQTLIDAAKKLDFIDKIE